MKDFDEYYSICHMKCQDSVETGEKIYGKRWWVKCEGCCVGHECECEGCDLDDAPVLRNCSGVRNSEWCCLHHILVRLLIDYITEHPLDNEVWSYSIEIDFRKKRWSAYFKDLETNTYRFPDSEYEIESLVHVCDHHIIDSYDGLNEMVNKFVNEFLERHDFWGVDLFCFSFDDIPSSLRFGEWCPSSDSSMSLYKDGEEVVLSM